MKITIEIDDNVDPMIAESLFMAARDGLNDRANLLKSRANARLEAVEEGALIATSDEDREMLVKLSAKWIAEIKKTQATYMAVSNAVRLMSFDMLQELGRLPR